MVMIETTALYRITTGNLFGISYEWIETFYRKAEEIITEMNDDKDSDSGYCCNPAFAGAWITVYNKETANRIQKCWNQLLPLALRSMNPRWRAEYDKDIATSKI